MKLTYFPSDLYVLNQLLLIDAQHELLGKLSTLISLIIQGKYIYTYNQSTTTKNRIIVINASKINISKKKQTTKIYYSHSNFIGGLKKKYMKNLFVETPAKILKYSIYKMLPKNSLRDKLIKNIKIYPNTIHPYSLIPLKKIIKKK
jgi:large subunit ribosomal protein L13